ncbi:MAG: GNAT family N-acetyltransferase [Pseudomonadota bacterium]
MQFRKGVASDAPALAQVFYKAVREGPSPYSDAQRAAWMPHPLDPVAFADRLADKQVMLCEDRGEAIGFMTLEPGGYIDLASILPPYRGRGVFRTLYVEIEALARQENEARLWVHASLMAQPAFQAMGFLVMHHETVARAGQQLARAEMEKHLT